MAVHALFLVLVRFTAVLFPVFSIQYRIAKFRIVPRGNSFPRFLGNGIFVAGNAIL
jgi:hypothetical protein|tara:strand:- start:2 stop:169 length:168 start_codon:yes stop_codon:yes gene_type:complete